MVFVNMLMIITLMVGAGLLGALIAANYFDSGEGDE